MVRDLRLVLPDHVIANVMGSLTGQLDSVVTIDEMDAAIVSWPGTENDPLLDELIRKRNELLETWDGFDPAHAAWAEQRENQSDSRSSSVAASVED